mmetsp:Transcript_61584/g.129979  ORF Transcript_61584/g.129979 Transcript_61584/m.129979 type:complete len:243 (+) Transcript_61584:112-840(+)
MGWRQEPGVFLPARSHVGMHQELQRLVVSRTPFVHALACRKVGAVEVGNCCVWTLLTRPGSGVGGRESEIDAAVAVSGTAYASAVDDVVVAVAETGAAAHAAAVAAKTWTSAHHHHHHRPGLSATATAKTEATPEVLSAAAAAAAVVMAAAVAAVAAFVVAVVAVAVGVVLAERDGVATGARGVPAGPFARGDAPGTATARGVPHSFRPCVGMQEGRCGRSGQLLCLDSTDEAWEWCRWERE